MLTDHEPEDQVALCGRHQAAHPDVRNVRLDRRHLQAITSTGSCESITTRPGLRAP